MKNAFILFVLTGMIGFSGCYGGFLDSDTDSISFPEYNYSTTTQTPCEPIYSGPGSIVSLSNGDEPDDYYSYASVLDSDEDHVYLFSDHYDKHQLIAIDKSSGLAIYKQRLPNQIKWHYNDQDVHSFGNEFWAYNKHELVSIDRRSGTQTIQLNFNNSYDEISRSEDGFIASTIVDCQDENFINLDLIDPQTEIAETFYTESLAHHVGADITYLGKYMDQKLLDLFLMNTHGDGIKENKIIAIDMSSKEKVWEQKLHFEENIFNQPNPYRIINGIFMIGADDNFYAYDLNRRAETQYQFSIDGINKYYRLAQYEESFIIFGGREQIIEVSSETGDILNNINIENESLSSNTAIAISQDYLYVAHPIHGLSIINLKTLEKIIQISSPRSECENHPTDFRNPFVIEDNKIYLSDNYSIYALTLEESDLVN